jgi:hypothetical protein
MTPRVRWLAFTLYVAAANADAEPEQREQLWRRLKPLLPLLRESSAVAGRILQNVHAVMGASWRPTGAWERQLSLLLGSEVLVDDEQGLVTSE